MSLTETEQNTFWCNKDGRWYPSYVELVAANRQAIDEVLRSKGLLDIGLGAFLKKRKKPAKTPSTPTRTRSSQVVTPPSRRSSRVRRSPPEKYGLELDFLEPPRRKKPKASPNNKSGPRAKVERITEEDLKALEGVPDWFDDMKEWLLKVPHGNGTKVVSGANARSVMNQVRKMVSGIGITYHHWNEGTYFKRGVKIHLGMEMKGLYDEAVEMEDAHGRDLGNGWLLRHPIRKMELYQEYRLLNKNKKK
jgi:hypothetical protein